MSAETNGAMPAYAFTERRAGGIYYATHYGLTKREAFAMAAMQGVQLSVGVLGGSAPTNYEQVAHMAVMQADALLEELAKGDRNGR